MPRAKLLATFEFDMGDKKAKLKIHDRQTLEYVLSVILDNTVEIKRRKKRGRAREKASDVSVAKEEREPERIYIPKTVGGNGHGIPVKRLTVAPPREEPEPEEIYGERDNGQLPSFVADNPWVEVLSKRKVAAVPVQR